MLGLTDWFRRSNLPERPWLVLGKGPTFTRRCEFDLGEYNLLSLNHAVREVNVDVAHIIDIDVVEACADVLAQNAKWLIMPRFPHAHARPGYASLDDYLSAVPVLRELDQQGRLVWYNARTAPQFVEGSPVVDVQFFSSEAALSILGLGGAREVRSLGVDGGMGYSSSFAGFAATRLANGQPSFDVQFAELDRIAAEHGIDFRPLVEPLRIYVGASRRDLVAVRVLAHSITRNASIPVRVVPMVDLPVHRPRRAQDRPRTGFSFSRFLVPELAGFHGRAVYLDSDMLVVGDVGELAELDFGSHTVLCTNQPEPPGEWRDHQWFHPGRQFSVMVLDCDRLRWRIEDIVHALDERRLTYRDLLFELAVVPAEQIADVVPAEWNHLEHYDPSRSKLVHFTVVDRQPWHAEGSPLEDLWFEHYREAVAAGAVPPDEVRSLAEERLIRPKLLEALDLAPAPRRYASSAADVALDAALNRIDELEARTAKGRLRAASRPFMPYVRRMKALGPSHPVGRLTQRAAVISRARLR